MSTGRILALPKKWPSEGWQSSWVPGVRVGNVLYVSGITASHPDGRPLGIGDFKAQAERCFEKLGDVLGRAGAAYADVAKLTTYLTPQCDAEALRAYFEVRARFFGSHVPASSGVTVHSLLRPEYMLEIDAVAHLNEA